jgi:hypothetical protein
MFIAQYLCKLGQQWQCPSKYRNHFYDHSNQNVQNLVMKKIMWQDERWSHINIWRGVCWTLIHLEKTYAKQNNFWIYEFCLGCLLFMIFFLIILHYIIDSWCFMFIVDGWRSFDETYFVNMFDPITLWEGELEWHYFYALKSEQWIFLKIWWKVLQYCVMS